MDRKHAGRVGEERAAQSVKATDAADTIGRLLKKVVEEGRHTGEIVIRMNCNQGGIRAVNFEVIDTRVTTFEFSGEQKNIS